MQDKWLVVVHGPTASGKTVLAIDLAQHYGTHILSADSRQFYRELRIGVARPTDEQLALAPHHFIAFLSVADDYNAGRFAAQAMASAEAIWKDHDVVVVAGGSGLYTRALVHGLDELPSDPAVRHALNTLCREQGIDVLRSELAQRDPVYFAQVDLQNPHRLIRALEVCRITGEPYSALRSNSRVVHPFHVLQVGLDAPPDWLRNRIRTRVDRMMEDGLESEARECLKYKNLPALKTVGYQEWFAHFEGGISRQEAIERIRTNTWHYARRQRTWYRKQEGISWFDATSGKLTGEVIRLIEEARSGDQ